MRGVRRRWALLATASALTATVAAFLAVPTASASGPTLSQPVGQPVGQPISTPVGCDDLAPVPGQAHCFSAIGRPAGVGVRPQATTWPRTNGWTPQDVAAMYGLPAVPASVPVGTGPTVAVVDAGGSASVASDLAAYRAKYALGGCGSTDGCFTQVNQRGGTTLPAPIAGWDFEISMDVEAVAAACPACRIVLVEADSAWTDDLDVAIDTAAGLASYVSMSFGSLDAGYTSTDVASTESVFAAHPDVTFVASSGDYGWATQVGDVVCGLTAVLTGGPTSSCTTFPASSPHVVSAGGTVASESSTGAWSQAVWGSSSDTSANAGGSSSGCSAWTSMSSAQATNAQARAACGTARGTADLAALADGFVTYHPMLTSTGTTANLWYGGGTSLSAPLLAGMYARAGNHTRPLDVYARANADPTTFQDVTSGSTRGCLALIDVLHLCSGGPGWDGPSGLGAPNGVLSLQPYAAGVPAPVPTPSSTPTASSTAGPTAGPTSTPTAGPTASPTAGPSDPGVPAPPPPTAVATPLPMAHAGSVRLVGRPRAGRTLRASYGAFAAGSSVTVTWLVGRHHVGTGDRLRVRPAWAHRRLRYVVTATAPGYLPLTLASPRTLVRR